MLRGFSTGEPINSRKRLSAPGPSQSGELNRPSENVTPFTTLINDSKDSHDFDFNFVFRIK